MLRVECLAVIGVVCAMVSCASAQPIEVERAPEWDALFDRERGWTGADGIFSIPLDGVDGLGEGTSDGRTLFVFSDTTIGNVNNRGQREPGMAFINNSVAVLRGIEAERSAIAFRWPGWRTGHGSGQHRSVFVPDTPNSEPGNWYWLLDGVAIDGTVNLLASRMGEGDGGGVFNFHQKGLALLQSEIVNGTPSADYRQVEVPFFAERTDEEPGVHFGAGIMANTQAAGAPHPDGYIYVYGLREATFTKKLLVARVEPASFADFAQWRFWDGSAWSDDFMDAAEVTGRVSNELSVTGLADGRYVCVFQRDGIGQEVAMRIGESPVGPWGELRVLWHCPEVEFDPDIFVYNAKAHPHLSEDGELLISYNVNTFDFFGDFFEYADIYRPRFIRVRFDR